MAIVTLMALLAATVWAAIHAHAWLRAWRKAVKVEHGDNDHGYKPALRWTDKRQRYVEVVHECVCGEVLEDRAW